MHKYLSIFQKVSDYVSKISHLGIYITVNWVGGNGDTQGDTLALNPG